MALKRSVSARPVPNGAITLLVITPSGVYAFARDYHLTNLIWSNVEGYPSDPVYREFYRDIGYDLPMEYIKPYIHEPQARAFTGCSSTTQ